MTIPKGRSRPIQCAQSASGNVVRLPRRRCAKQLQDALQAQILDFPDQLGITAPPFDPANPKHVAAWQRWWRFGAEIDAAEQPIGHPLRDWWERERARLYGRYSK
jgi:hypothetical protein